MTHDLSPLGWDETFASAYRRFERRDAAPARVLRADRGVCTVLGADGVSRASLAGAVLLAAAHDPAALPCAGDWVVVRRWPDRRSTVESVLPRRTALRRGADMDPAVQVLGANMDTVAVVEPTEPAPDVARIAHLLSLAVASGAQPVVLLSKIDRAREDLAALARRVARGTPGLPVLPVSVLRGTGLERVRRLVTPGRTLALLGCSGAGKSTLVNALAGATVLPGQAVRGADGKARQPTAHHALVPVPGGGAVLDIPGTRGHVGVTGRVGGRL
jgi:ribosome biogenesis GTPase